MEIKTVKENKKITKSFPVEIEKEGEDRIILDFTVQKKDRDNEVLLIDGADLEDYQENPIIQADHDFSVRSTVGSFEWVKKYPTKNPDRIRGLPRFASTDFARDVETLVKEKHLKTASHTFMGMEYTENSEDIKQLGQEYGFNPEGVGRVYTKWSPLEISWVTIPSNTGARAHLRQLIQEGKIKSKAFKDIVEKSEEEAEEDENKGAVPYKKFPLANKDRKWDAGAAVKRLHKWAGGPDKEDIDFSKYRTAFCWYDSDEPENLTSYKFPVVDVIDGTAKVVWRAVVNARARLPQSNIPLGDKTKIESRLKKYYKDFDMDWEKSESEKDIYTEENIKKSVKGSSINQLMEIISEIKKRIEEAETIAKSISEIGQDSQPESGDQSVKEESDKTAEIVDYIRNYERR